MAADDADFSVWHLPFRLDFVAAQLFYRLGDVQLAFKMGLR